MSRKRLLCLTLVIFASIFSLNSLVGAYPSGSYGSGSYNSCNYGTTCSVSVTDNGAVSLNITPASGGLCTIQSSVAQVLTDDANGYVLTLGDTSTNTALVNGSSSINAVSGTLSSPATLTDNSWGYREDGWDSFGSGPTSAQTNVSIGSATFAGIESSSNTPDTIASTTAAADPAVSTTIWYGACADTSVAIGNYTTQVTYTALAN